MQAKIRLWRYFVAPLALACMLGIASAAELNPAAVFYKLPDQIPGALSTPPARKLL